MSSLASLKSQLAQAACFLCLPVNYQQAIKTYLLAKNVGGSLDPKTLLAQARGFSGIQEGYLPAYQAVFGSIMAGGTGDVSKTVAANACDGTCITPQNSLAIQIVSLAQKAGGATDPKTLATLAACFICIPPNKLIALQTFLMGILSGTITAPGTNPGGNPTIGPPPTIPPSVKFFATKAFGYPPGFIPAIIGDAIAAWQGSFFIPTPTGFSFVEASDKSAVNASWDVPPATVDHTELWTSADNITFTLEKTVAAPGTSTTGVTAPVSKTRFGKIRWCSVAGCSGFTAVQSATNVANPLTTTWLVNITNNGGPPPSDNTGTAINTFFTNLDSCGITSKILSMAMFVPDSLIAAITPLVSGTFFNPWQNTNFVGGDLTINGLTGNGTTKFLDSGLRPAFAGPQFTVANCSLFFYAHTANSTALGTEIGTTDGANDGAFVSNFNFGGLATFSDLLGVAPRLGVATPGNGFYLASRIAANNNQIYFANSVTPWASIANNAIGSSGLATTGFLVFAFNNNGAAAQWSNSTLSCAGIASGLTTTEGQCLFNAIQACRVALGGGFR